MAFGHNKLWQPPAVNSLKMVWPLNTTNCVSHYYLTCFIIALFTMRVTTCYIINQSLLYYIAEPIIVCCGQRPHQNPSQLVVTYYIPPWIKYSLSTLYQCTTALKFQSNLLFTEGVLILTVSKHWSHQSKINHQTFSISNWLVKIITWYLNEVCAIKMSVLEF